MKKTIILLLTILIVSCLPDRIFGPELTLGDTDIQNDILFQENFGEQIAASFIGRIVNTQGNGIGDVQVAVGNAVSTTDYNGVFVLHDVMVFEYFAYIKANHPEYLFGSRTIVPSSTSVNDIQITLLKKNIVETINSGSATEINYNGSTVTFSGDFTDANGQQYNGPVDVSIHYLNPNETSTFNRMPGSLFGQRENNDASVLETYGMIAVDLFGSSGEQLNIDETAPSVIEFPVAAEQISIAPETINLWYFDESVGYWKEEGQATKVGDKYVAEVSHFSWWNCDLPLDYITACFNLETENGNLANNYIEITRNQTGQTIYAGYTNSEGAECGLFPKDEVVTVKVYGDTVCESEIIHVEEVGPYGSNTTFSILVPTSNIEETSIVATINNCSGQPLIDGYALIFNSDLLLNNTTLPIIDGVLDTYLTYCTDNSVSFDLIVFDQMNEQNSGVLSFDLNPGITNLGQLSTCSDNGGIYEGDVTLETQDEVNNFGVHGYSSVEGSLFIGTYPINNDIVDLSPLSTLSVISNNLDIVNCQITSLTGLHNIISVYDLSISRNDNLIELSDFETLEQAESVYVGGNYFLEMVDGFSSLSNTNLILVHDNYNLQIIDGFDGMNDMASTYLWIYDNNSLVAIEAFSQVENFYAIELDINPSLIDLSGFNNARSALGIAINECDLIENLAAFSNLETLGLNYSNVSAGLVLYNNANLNNLQGLESLIYVNPQAWISIGVNYSNEEIEANPLLDDYCSLQNLFTNGTYNVNRVRIENNAYNPSVQDIIDGNCMN